MQTFTMKLWTAAAGAAAATTMAAPQALPHPEDVPTTASPTDFVYPTGFDHSLSLMLAGVGVENGIGSHWVGPTLSFTIRRSPGRARVGRSVSSEWCGGELKK